MMSLFPALCRAGVAATLIVASAAALAQAQAAQAPVSLVPSASFAAGGKTVQNLLRKQDFTAARTVLGVLASKVSTDADRYLFGHFQFTIGRYFNDAAMQLKGLETMLAAGLASPADAARYHYYAGQFALNARDFAGARDHLLTAAAAGEGSASTQVHLAETYFSQARDHVAGEGFDAAGKALVRQGLPHLRRAIAMVMADGKSPDAQWVGRGLDLARLAEDPDVESWRQLAAQIPPKTPRGM